MEVLCSYTIYPSVRISIIENFGLIINLNVGAIRNKGLQYNYKIITGSGFFTIEAFVNSSSWTGEAIIAL
jgi:hypothetical protein